MNPIHEPATASPGTALPARTQRGWTIFRHGSGAGQGTGAMHNPMHGGAAPEPSTMINNPMRAPSANSSSSQPPSAPSNASAAPSTGTHAVSGTAVPVSELGVHQQFDVVRTMRGETLSL